MVTSSMVEVEVSAVVGLIDAVVASVDIGRAAELDRLREALRPLAAADLFDAELRLSGESGAGDACCGCFCGELADVAGVEVAY